MASWMAWRDGGHSEHVGQIRVVTEVSDGYGIGRLGDLLGRSSYPLGSGRSVSVERI